MTDENKEYVVVLFQYRLFHYRRLMLESLRQKLKEMNVRLEVVYGQAFGKEKLKNDEAELPWGHRVKNLYIPFKEKKDLCWQPIATSICNPDMVIFMQENRLLANYYWILRGKLGAVKTAYWGHGRDFQSLAPGGLRERWKKLNISAVDWWFAYTPVSVEIVRESGFPNERITLLNNSIDTVGFRQDVDNVSRSDLENLRSELGIPDDSPVGLFCGSIYPDKKPIFMIQAADYIRSNVPNFHFIIIGDGQSAFMVHDAAATRPWLHCVGSKRDGEKAALFKLASFMMNPGSVGLHVLDAFAVGLPMLTTATALHGPEISYLQHGVTGFITAEDTIEYAQTAINLIQNPEFLGIIRDNCIKASMRYSIENMAENFAAGILRGLNSEKLQKSFT